MDHLHHLEPKPFLSGQRLAGFFCLLWALSGCDSEPPQHLVDEGKLLLAQGDYETARLQFQNALQLDPKLAEAYFNLAIIEEQNQDWSRMLGDLLETVALAPGHLEAQLRLGQIYFAGGQYDKAAERADTVLQLEPEHQTATLLQASIWLAQGKTTAARRNIETVLAKDPFSANALGLQANLLVAEKQVDRALGVLQTGVAHHPNDRELRLFKIRLASERQRWDEAVADYRALITRFPGDTQLHSAFARLLVSAGRPLEAVNTLRAALRDYPEQSALILQLADLLEARDPAQTEQLLQDFVTRNPSQTEGQLRMADFFFKQRRFKEARAILEPLAHTNDTLAENLVATLKLAQVALAENDLAEVARLAERVLVQDPQQSDALLLRAGMRLHKRDAAGAIADLRVVLRDRPDSAQALLLLAQSSVLQAQTDMAESYWRKVLAMAPANMAALLPLTQALLKRGNYAGAEEHLLRAIDHAADDAAAPLELLIQTRLIKRDWPGVEAALKEMRSQPSGELPARYWAANLAETKGETAQAIRRYQELLAIQPSHPQALTELQKLFAASGRSGEWLAYLQRLIAKTPTALPVVNQLVLAHTAGQRWPEAEQWLLKAIALQPGDSTLRLNLVDVVEKQSDERAETLLKSWVSASADRPEYKIRLADHYTKRGRHDDAIPWLQQAYSESQPNAALVAGLKLAQAYQQIGALSKAESVLQELLTRRPDHLAALNALTAQLSTQGKSDKALPFIARAEQASPHQPQILELKIQANLGHQNWPNAQNAIAELAKLPHAELSAKMWEAHLAIAQDNPSSAVRTINEVLREHPNQQGLYTVLADAHLRNQDVEKAIAAYEQLLRKFPNNDQAANNLAELLVSHPASSQERLGKALALVERFKGSPRPELLDTYAWVHLQAGEVEKSVEALETAVQAGTQIAAIHYHLGEAYRKTGAIDKAITELETALALANQHGDDWLIEPVNGLLNQLR